MRLSRRNFLSLLGSLPLLGIAPPGVSTARPRHVLCFLGGDAKAYARLKAGMSSAISAHARDFAIDETYSTAEPDAHMDASFAVCWDRVAPNAWTRDDELAVSSHQSVLYVLGPPMTPEASVATSATALKLVDAAIAAGALAIKGESAGVAHGLRRWRQLIAHARDASDVHALRRTCRLAFAKRPLAGDEFLESVGFHLVGLPEVYVSNSYPNERAATAFMDIVADELSRMPLASVLEKHGGRLAFESSYEPDDFKFNPYGTVLIDGDG